MSSSVTPTLAALYKTYPELTQGLVKETTTPLASSPDEPFQSDLEYLMLCNAIFDVQYNYNETCGSVRSYINYPKNNPKEGTLADVPELLKLAKGYSELREYGLDLVNKRLEANRNAKILEPRTVRLAKKVQLTEKETYAMAYIVLTNAQMLTCRYGRGFDFPEMAQACDMNLQEAMTFLAPSRTHVKEAVISPSEDDPFSYGFKVPYTTVSVLAGLKLSEETLLKVDKTVLAEVLIEEENEEYSMLTAGTAEERKEKAKKSSDPFASDSDDGGSFNLSDFLKKRSKEGKGDKGSEEEEEEKEEEDKEDENDDFEKIGKDDDEMEEKEEKEEEEEEEEEKKPRRKGRLGRRGGVAKRRTAIGKGKKAKVDEDEEMDEEEEEEEKKDIFEMVRDEIQHDKAKKSEPVEETEVDSKKLQPYSTNTAYLSDHIEWLAVLIRLKHMVQENESELTKDVEKEAQIREHKAKERMLRTKCEKRLAITLASGKWVPRLEKLVSHSELSHFEKMVLLVLTANVLSPKISPDDSRYGSRVSNFTVGDLMGLFADGFEQEIEFRRFFYKNSKLVKEGLISLQDSYRNTELMNMDVELDRRMLDFIVGLDTEFSELVEGSHLYTPTVKLDRVILPEKQKAHIVESVRNFEQFQKNKKKLGLDEFLSYGSGMVLLFYGKSGTGKTMMANAIANMLGKRILLINYPSMTTRDSEILIKFIFREAKLTDSIIFFDECENIFQSRDRSDSSVNLLLTEIENHNNLVIMATNRAFDLDEAMHRRITLSVEFKVPNPRLRKAIWQSHIPDSVKLADDVSFDDLAMKFELSGGFIKNTILSALSSAVARNPSDPVVSMADLAAGADYQLRARLAMVEFDNRVVPDHGLDDVVTTSDVIAKLRRIVAADKARQVLYSEWGYTDKGTNAKGISVLFYGPHGSGKTHAAEAIGFETGKPLKVENGWGQSNYFDSDFKEAHEKDAVLVYENAEGFFTKEKTQDGKEEENKSAFANFTFACQRYPVISIIMTSAIEHADETFLKRFQYIVHFPLPDAANRQVLWKKMLPPHAPLASDVDFKILAEKYKFSGGSIKNACFKASATAALRIKETEQAICMKDLVEAAEEETTTPLPEAIVYV